MKRTVYHCHSPEDEFKSYNKIPYSRSNTPCVEPSEGPKIPIPGGGYWIRETSPAPIEYRTVFVEPPPLPRQQWYSSPIVHYGYNTPRLLATPPRIPPIQWTPYLAPPPPISSPPLAFYDSNIYRDSYSSHPYYSRENDHIVKEKPPFQVKPTSDSFNEEHSTSYRLNPSESPIKHKISKKASWEESFVTPKHKINNKKFKASRKNLVEKVEVEVKEGNGNYTYCYNKSNCDLHPEVLAMWQKKLNKSKETSNTEVKIEIHLKNDESIRTKTTKRNLEEGGKYVQESSHKKKNQSSMVVYKGKRSPKSRRLYKKMASSPSSDGEKCSVKVVSPEKRSSTSDDNKSSLKFTPLQIHKVHKRRKDDRQKNPPNRRHYYIPIKEALETIGHGESPEKNTSSSSYRDKSSESFCKSSSRELELWRSSYKPDQDVDSGLETSRSREGSSQSPTKASGRNSVSSRNSSLSAFGSQKFEKDLDSDSDYSQNSSVYATPEGTPFFNKSRDTEGKQQYRFKRSLSDDYADEGQSANSSFNTSAYYTPESSPRTFFQNSAKRLKTRWSDSSSFSVDNSPYLSWRNKSSDSSEQKIQPELIGYQMVGDSQFCRFGQQLLGLERVPMPNSPGRIGICVSGQTITDLHRRVKDNFYPISDKIILMIGTNDFLRNVNVATMCVELSSLVETLKKSASNIILLTLPPIPKLEKKNSMTHFKLLDIFNTHIRSLESGKALRVADVSPLYITSTPHQRCKMHLFEVFFNGPAKRIDLIHLNRLGLEVIRKYILDKFL